jgi:hypothetical protein
VFLCLQRDAGPGGSEHSSWKQVASPFLDWQLYVWSLNYIGILVPLLSLSLFLPTIVQSLGFVRWVGGGKDVGVDVGGCGCGCGWVWVRVGGCQCEYEIK